MKVVVLTFDRLPASLLGCYGNEWVETPHFDRLAAESTVFPSTFVEIPGVAGPEHPWWTGRFEFFQGVSDGAPSGRPMSLFGQLTAAGITFRLLSERADGLPPRGVASSTGEESSTRESASASESAFEIVSGDDGLDIEHGDVPFARLVQRATEILDGPADEIPDLLWLHSRGVPSPWLPPEFFAGLYLDELEDQDESEATGREIADALLDQLRDEPDLVRLLLSDPDDDGDDAAADAELIATELGDLGDRVRKYVFAGYVSLLDHCLQTLLETVSRRDDTLLLVTAAGGVTFGERAAFLASDRTARDLAEADDDVCDSLLRVPLLIRPPGPATFGNRSMQTVLPPDICATLLGTLTDSRQPGTGPLTAAVTGQHSSTGINLLPPSAAGPEGSAPRTALHLGAAGTLGIRSREWLLTIPDGLQAIRDGANPDDIEDQAGLYAQPDDRWSLNNLTRQRPGIYSELFAELRSRMSALNRADG
ncbi:sulfatase-like hydrolase/transferase [bacterium]|nr:sulfatase-like hydrolase/transferase [bacterium]